MSRKLPTTGRTDKFLVIKIHMEITNVKRFTTTILEHYISVLLYTAKNTNFPTDHRNSPADHCSATSALDLVHIQSTHHTERTSINDSITDDRHRNTSPHARHIANMKSIDLYATCVGKAITVHMSREC